jgi:hypothetical protein
MGMMLTVVVARFHDFGMGKMFRVEGFVDCAILIMLAIGSLRWVLRKYDHTYVLQTVLLRERYLTRIVGNYGGGYHAWDISKSDMINFQKVLATILQQQRHEVTKSCSRSPLTVPSTHRPPTP